MNTFMIRTPINSIIMLKLMPFHKIRISLGFNLMRGHTLTSFPFQQSAEKRFWILVKFKLIRLTVRSRLTERAKWLPVVSDMWKTCTTETVTFTLPFAYVCVCCRPAAQRCAHRVYPEWAKFGCVARANSVHVNVENSSGQQLCSNSITTFKNIQIA